MRRAITDAWLGKRATRVILPISDPYVTHHGALGSFTTIYAANERGAPDLIERIASLPGMELVLDRAEACRRSELPEDRIGDIVAISCQDVVIGSSVSRHDLCGLDAPLRSHGGLSSRRSRSSSIDASAAATVGRGCATSMPSCTELHLTE